jgi:hypothetical protein
MARGIKKSTKQPTVRRSTRVKALAPATQKREGLLTKTKRATKTLKPKVKHKNAINTDEKIKRDLRSKISVMKTELKSAKQERKEAVRRERANGAAVRNELKEALKREQALIRLIDARDEALRGFSDKWTKQKIAQIQAPAKKRRRRRKGVTRGTVPA